MNRIEWMFFDMGQLDSIAVLPRKVGNPAGSKHRPDYLPIIATFDTETSTIEHGGRKHSFVYVWMFYLPHIDTMITGRTIEEYVEFAKQLSGHLNGVLLTFVHNLSYEFAYLAGAYKFSQNPLEPDVFSVKPRKILTCKVYKLEHRCSMLLSNLSLASYTKEMQVEHQKLSGADYDYSKLRYPWTKLDDNTEWPYCTNDVVGLAEAVLKEIELSKKDLYHFPMTSTGFVRQDLRKAVRHIADNLFKKLQPDFRLYQFLRRGFRGGDVHANRRTAGQVNPAGFSYDRSSSYPDVQCNHMFPMSPFTKVDDPNIDQIMEERIKHKKAFIMHVKFYNIRLRRNDWGFPYIPADHWHVKLPDVKTTKVKINGKWKTIKEDLVTYDNGRVIDSPWVEMYITDVDFDIILKEYIWDDLVVYEAYKSRYGNLPRAFTDVVKMYYSLKTSLKGDESEAVLYAKMKARLNAVYGCTAQDIIKPDLAYDPKTHDWVERLYNKETHEYEKIYDCPEFDENGNPYIMTPEEREAGEKKVFDAKIQNAWLPYQFAVWTTAWARWELHQGLWNVVDQGGDPLYCDTDSVKYLGEWVTWDSLNNRLRANSEKSEAFAKDIKGIPHYMGMWEKEGKAYHSFERFASLGAKKYAYEELDPKEYTLKLKTTIAAVDRKGAAELAKAFGPYALDHFAACRKNENEFTFVESGGTALIYNDDDDIWLTIDGHQLHIGSNVVITDDIYKLSLQEDYSVSLPDPEFLDLSID